jgi:HEPN domain-containing protein
LFASQARFRSFDLRGIVRVSERIAHMMRADFQRLAELRLSEAEALLRAGLWAGAYYLAGYAVEHALKACIAKRTRAEEYPPRNTKESHYVHDVKKLVVTADLESELKAKRADTAFADNWKVVTDWNEHARYEDTWTQAEAEALLKAIADPINGVVTWIRAHW